MAINARRRQQIVLDLFEVGMADTTGFHANEDFSAPNGRSCHGLHGYLAFANIDGSLHLARNLFTRQRCCYL